jgi:hypothetical protein
VNPERQKVCFSAPKDMVVRSGVAVLAGYLESGTPYVTISTVEDTPTWVRASLLKTALESAEEDMRQMLASRRVD